MTETRVDEAPWPGKFEVQRTDGADRPDGPHEHCRYLVLDLDHDPAAQAVARIYAAKVVHTRPRMSAMLREAVSDDLRPGERYVTPEEVEIDTLGQPPGM
jgi:hypothetical protein